MAAKSTVISPSVLKVLSLATSAMALKATSERWGASKREMADRHWHLESSACWRKVSLNFSTVRSYVYVDNNICKHYKANFLLICLMCCKWSDLPRCSYLTVWACHWLLSHWVKGIRQKCIWTHWLSSGRKGKKYIYDEIWVILLDVVSPLLTVPGPHKVKPYIWN